LIREIEISLGSKLKQKSTFSSIYLYLRQKVLIEKLYNRQGYAILLFSALFIAYAIYYLQIAGAALVLIAVCALPFVYAIVAYPSIGILIILTSAYLIMWVLRMGVNFPLGTLMDGIEVLLIFGFFLQIKRNKDWERFKNPVSIIVLIWIVYNIVQFANPTAESRLAWVYTIRSVAIVMLLYFIFVYNIRTMQLIRIIMKLWIGLAFFAACYAFKQQHFDFFPFEKDWLYSDPNIEQLLFIDGQWRKFSIFSDPVAFSYNMVGAATICICLASSNAFSKAKKTILWVIAFWLLLNMLYSGTRGAYVLLPAAMILYFILNFSKKVLLVGSIGALFVLFLIFVPTSSPTIVRFQTAFKPNDDPSFNVRKNNQKRIQPYILSHPLGGGLGATGTWGQRFAPHSYLANFPPDSGYVRVAVELGSIGLAIFCFFMFVILRQGINSFFLIQDPERKAYCLAMTLVICAYNIGNFPQEAIVQFPSNIYFYLAAALIQVLYRMDLQQQKENDEKRLTLAK